jgi:NAD(P)-dependent dehydrogenase (short-subunit alcohol dehydrogenase family)
MPVEYSAIKSGLIHLTKYMAKYLKGKNIRVNTLSPGGILDKQPQEFLNSYKDLSLNKGMLDKEDLTGSLIFLLSDQSKYINGQNIIVDDGFTL